MPVSTLGNHTQRHSLIDVQKTVKRSRKNILNKADVGGQAHGYPDHAGIKLAITDEV